MNPIPQWLLENEKTELAKCGVRNDGFLTHTLKEISSVMQNDLLAERFAGKRGLFQGLDPRVRFLSVLFLMLAAGTTRSLPALIILLTAVFLTAGLSGLDMKAYIKRVWLILPLILLLVSVPAATSLLIPGRVLTVIPGTGLYFSIEGAASVMKMVLRTGVSISLGYVLVMTSRWHQITGSLAVLRVPKLIITVLDMTYRYIFVLSRLAVEMFEARKLRTVGKISNKDNRKYMGASMAFIFVKASFISEEVYNAMLCRGGGEPVASSGFRLSAGDFVWIFNVLVISAVVFIL